MQFAAVVKSKLKSSRWTNAKAVCGRCSILAILLVMQLKIPWATDHGYMVKQLLLVLLWRATDQDVCSESIIRVPSVSNTYPRPPAYRSKARVFPLNVTGNRCSLIKKWKAVQSVSFCLTVSAKP